MQETWAQTLGWEDPLEKEMANHSSILAWKISWPLEPGGLQSMGSQRVGHDWVTNTLLILNIYTSLLSLGFGRIPCIKQINSILVLKNAKIFSYIVQFSSVTQLCPTLCNPMNCSMPGLPVHHQPLEFTQTQVHQVGDTIQPSYPLSSPSSPALNLSQHQDLFKWVSSSHQMAKVLEFQLKPQSFQWTPSTDLL